MRGFSTKRHETVTLTRGDESIDFEVHPLPAGWWMSLRSAFPPPVMFKDGKEIEKTAAMPEYQDLFGFLQLAKHLEPSGALESRLPDLNAPREKWHNAAHAVRNEFRAAGFTDGEVVTLVRAGMRLNQGVDVMADLGNLRNSSPENPES